MNDKLPTNDNSQLREQMWDLVYGLLEQDESRDLITRIKSDPQAARLYAEVRLQADLVGYASQVEDSSLVLTGDSAAREVAPAASRKKTDKAAAALGRTRSGNILAGIVAAALALLIGVGLFWPQVSEHQLAQNYLVIDMSAPRDLPGGITNEVPVRVARLDGVGQMAEGEATVFSADGTETYSAKFLTNGVGHGKVTIPGEAMQPGAKLTVAAAAVDASRTLAENELKELDLKKLDDQIDEVHVKQKSAPSSLTAALPVREEPQMKYFFSESPLTEPGQENQLAMWGVNSYSNTPAPVKVAEVAVEDDAGTSVAKPMWRSEGNVAVFRFALPEAAENRETLLGIRDAEGDKYQAPLDGIVMQQSSKSLEKKDGVRYRLAPNDANDVRPPRGPAAEAPAPLSAAIAPPAPAATPGPSPAKPGEPLGDEQRQLASSGYARGNELPAQQPANSLDRSVVASVAEKESLAEVTKLEREGLEGKKAASKGVTFAIPAEHANRRLFVRLNYRGLDVAEKQIDAEKLVAATGVADGRTQKLSGQEVAFELPPEVSGPVEMQLYDADSYELLQRQIVVRESSRKLNVSIVDGKESYVPGEVVSLTLQFTDENGQPAPGTQGGVRLWNEQLVQSLGKRPLLLADALQATNEYLAYGEFQNLERARSFGVPLTANRAKKEAESPADQKLAMSRLELLKADAAKAQAVAVASQPESAGADAPLAATPAPDASEPATEAAQASDGLALGGEGFGGGAGSARFYADNMAESYKYELETRFSEMETPQILASNSALVHAEYEAAKRQRDDERQARQAAIGRILLFGGIGAAALLGLLMLLKLPAKARVVVPSLALAAASVALGWSWIGTWPGAGLQQIAMVEDQSGLESTPPASRPMGMPARAGEEFDLVAVNDRAPDPSALGIESASGAVPASADYGNFAAGGLEAANMPAPAGAPADAPTEGAPTPLYAKESFSGAVPGSGGFALPSGGAAKGPAGRGGTDADRESAFARETLERQKMADLAEAKQMEQRKAGTDLQLAQGKNLPEAIGSRGGAGEGSFDQPLAKSMRSVRPATTPALPTAPGLAPESKPAAAGTSDVAPAPAAPISPEFDEKDAASDKAGIKAKIAAGNKPEGKLEPGAADFNEENRDLLDRFGSDVKRRSMTTGRLPELRGDGAIASGAPASIYFNPRLIADDNGRATIEFTMPAVESEYRLLIDALGSGRIGALQQVIECREAAK